MSRWFASWNLCGWLGLGLCWPYAFVAALWALDSTGHQPDLPNWTFGAVFYGILYGTPMATVLGLAAAVKASNWWLALFAASLLTYGFLWWYFRTHPFDI